MGKKIYLEIELSSDEDDDDYEMTERHLLEKLNDGELHEVRGARDLTAEVEHIRKSYCGLFASRKDLGEVSKYVNSFTGEGEAVLANTAFFMGVNTIAKLLGVAPKLVLAEDPG